MVEGINSNLDVKYTLESLGIKEGSKEASIFKEIDLSDGIEDGFLNKEQYQEYSKRTFSKTQSFFKGLWRITKAIWNKYYGNAIKQKENAQISDETRQAYEAQGGQNSLVQSSAEGLKKLEKNN